MTDAQHESVRVKHARPGRRVRRDAALTVPITLRLAEDEAAIVRDAAALAGISVAQWLRQAVIPAVNHWSKWRSHE